jgi:CRISPR/Cas system CMR-associated protein Cmr5 small subunit
MNAHLQAELTAAKACVAEVECRETALKTDYGSLCNNFDDLQTANAALVKEKENVEKVERVKAQRFHNLLRIKLAGLRLDME